MPTPRRFPAALALCLCLAVPGLGQESEASEMDARLTRVEGPVYIHLSHHKEGEFIEAEPGAQLQAGDMVRTGTGGSAEVALDGESVIDIGPDSDFILNSIDPEEAEFHLGIGSLVAKIRSLLQGQSLEFHTSNAVAAVRGTELGVVQEADEKPTRIGVFDEGQVAVTSSKGGNAVSLGPGQETEIREGTPARVRGLQALQAHRQRIAFLRQRRELLRQGWERRTMEQRRLHRRQMAQKRVLRLEHLRQVRQDRLKRSYQDLRQRRAQLRRRRAARLKALRKERRKNR